MTEEEAHRLKCDMQFAQNARDLERIEREFDDKSKKTCEKSDRNAEELTKITATLNERQRAGGSRTDILAKVVPTFIVLVLSGAVTYLSSELKGIRKVVADNKTADTEWRGKHTGEIEHRDTVQCLSIQTVQISHNNANPEHPISVIDCGVGAGK